MNADCVIVVVFIFFFQFLCAVVQSVAEETETSNQGLSKITIQGASGKFLGAHSSQT